MVCCEHVALQDGTTAMMMAAEGGHKDTVELMLDRGADLEAKDEVSQSAGAAACRVAPGIAGERRAATGIRRRRWGRASGGCRVSRTERMPGGLMCVPAVRVVARRMWLRRRVAVRRYCGRQQEAARTLWS